MPQHNKLLFLTSCIRLWSGVSTSFRPRDLRAVCVVLVCAVDFWLSSVFFCFNFLPNSKVKEREPLRNHSTSFHNQKQILALNI